jgi:hypothetical protein
MQLFDELLFTKQSIKYQVDPAKVLKDAEISLLKT